MLTVNQVIDLPALLAAAVSERRVRAHSLRPVQYAEETRPLNGGEGTLRLRLSEFQLLGDVGDDPEIALLLNVASEVQTSTSAAAWGQYSYEGSPRRVSAWLADDARLFREEIKLAVLSLAKNIVQDLNSPHAVAVSKANRATYQSNPATSTHHVNFATYVPNLRKVGKIDTDDVFPAGDLYVDENVNYTDSDNDLRRLFVVKFPSPSAKGERSYKASMKIKCSTGAFSVVQSMTSATENGTYPAITSQEHSPLVLDKPSAQLASAIREVCEQ